MSEEVKNNLFKLYHTYGGKRKTNIQGNIKNY